MIKFPGTVPARKPALGYSPRGLAARPVGLADKLAGPPGPAAFATCARVRSRALHTPTIRSPRAGRGGGASADGATAASQRRGSPREHQ
jgi:hypothetical protein